MWSSFLSNPKPDAKGILSITRKILSEGDDDGSSNDFNHEQPEPGSGRCDDNDNLRNNEQTNAENFEAYEEGQTQDEEYFSGEDENEYDDGYDDGDGPSIVANIVGNRFNYMERVAKSFMKQVVVTPTISANQQNQQSVEPNEEYVSPKITREENDPLDTDEAILSETMEKQCVKEAADIVSLMQSPSVHDEVQETEPSLLSQTTPDHLDFQGKNIERKDTFQSQNERELQSQEANVNYAEAGNYELSDGWGEDDLIDATEASASQTLDNCSINQIETIAHEEQSASVRNGGNEIVASSVSRTHNESRLQETKSHCTNEMESLNKNDVQLQEAHTIYDDAGSEHINEISDGWGEDLYLEDTEGVDEGDDLRETSYLNKIPLEKVNSNFFQNIEHDPTPSLSSSVYKDKIQDSLHSERDRRDETSALTFDSIEINVAETNLVVVHEKQDFDSTNAWNDHDDDNDFENLTSDRMKSPALTFDRNYEAVNLQSNKEVPIVASSVGEKLDEQKLEKENTDDTGSDKGGLELLLSSPQVPQPISERAVDQTPPDLEIQPKLCTSPSKLSVLDDPSVRVLAASEDMTRDTGNAEFEEDDVYDDENEFNFGPIVDQTPTRKTTRSKDEREGRDSLVVLPSQGGTLIPTGDGSLMTDDADEDVDNNDAISSYSPPVIKEEDFNFANALTPVVDHTPDDSHKISMDFRVSLGKGLSLRVCPSEGDTLDNTILDGEDDLDRSEGDPNIEVEKEDKNTAHVFGPVVDLIPPTPAISLSMSKSGANSLAVNFATLEEDFRDDAAMDETYYGDSTIGFGEASVVGGGSTVGISTVNDGWGDEDLVFDGDDGDTISKSQGANESKKSEKKTTTFSLEANTFRTDVVDHTPSEFAIDDASRFANPSVAALASSVDLSGEADSADDEDVYEYENEHTFGQVVDHTPKFAGIKDHSTSMESLANSVAAQASLRDDTLNYDDTMENTSYGGDSSIGRTVDLQRNETLSKTTINDNLSCSFGTSTEKIKVSVVDHTPSDIGSPSNMKKDPSVEVVPSEVNTRATEDADSTGESNLYGPVVDLTPSTPSTVARQTRSDSVVVQVYDLETVDETTAVGGSRDEDDDDEYCDDDDIPGELPSDTDKLVDHVPSRSEARFGDASTVVAADPSEVISEVDDLAPEEQNFGPVVDLTPFSQPATVAAEAPSGAASTAVFAPPSIAADDLDEDPANESQGEPNEGWDASLVITTELAPNPQSGNEDELQATEINEQQVVDFVPPVTEAASCETDDVAREGFSEMTIGGAQSLLQTGDPVEDDFGPVVDLTPFLPPSNGLDTAAGVLVHSPDHQKVEKHDDQNNVVGMAHLKASVVVNPLPSLVPYKTIDSIATAGKSQISEEEEGEDEDDLSKFGPVVDQLPTSRISLTPSRGGSTVDALANVSEANSEYDEEGVGWDDDVDFDTSLGGVSEGTSRQTIGSSLKLSKHPVDHDKNISVRFDTSVMDDRSSVPTLDMAPSFHRSQYYNEPDNRSGFSQGIEPWNEDIDSYDDEPKVSKGSLSVQHTAMLDKSFAEADTPPSTPYRRTVPESMAYVHDSTRFPIHLPEMTTNNEGKLSILPIVQPLPEANSATTYASNVPHKPLQPDYLQELENERAKCRSLAEQLSIARLSMKENDQLRDSLVKVREYELQGEISVLMELREKLTKQLRSHQDENDDLRQQCVAFQRDLVQYRTNVSNLEEDMREAKAKETILNDEIKALQLQLDNAQVDTAKLIGELREQINELLMEVQLKEGLCKELHATISNLESANKDANITTGQGEQHMEKFKQITAVLDQQILSLESIVVQSGQSVSIDQQDLSHRSGILNDIICTLQTQIADLKLINNIELRDKSSFVEADIVNLAAQLQKSETERKSMASDLAKHRALGTNSELLAKELLAIAEENDALQRSLSECQESLGMTVKAIDSLRTDRKIADTKHAEIVASLKLQVENLEGDLLKQSNESIVNVLRLENERDALNRDVEALRSALKLSESTIDKISTSIHELEETSRVLARDNEALKQDHKVAVEKSLSLENELAKIKEKYDVEIASKDRSLHALMSENETLKAETLSSSDSLAASIERVNKSEKDLLEQRELFHTLTQERDELIIERDNMLVELALIARRLSNVDSEDEEGKKVTEQLVLDKNKLEKELRTLQDECVTLRERTNDLERSQNESIRLEKEKQNLLLTIQANNEKIKEMEEMLESEKFAVSQLEAQYKVQEEQRENQVVELSVLKKEHENCRIELESRLETTKALLSEKKMLLDECTNNLNVYLYQNESLTEEISAKSAMLTDLEASLQECRKKEVAQEEMLGSLRFACEELKSQLQSTTNLMEEQAKEHLLELKNMKLNEDKLVIEVREKQMYISGIEEEMEQLRLELQKTRDASFEEIAIKETQIVELTARLEEADATLFDKENECNRLNEELVEVRSENACLRQIPVESLELETVNQALSLVRTEQERTDAMKLLVERRKKNQETIRQLTEAMTTWCDSL